MTPCKWGIRVSPWVISYCWIWGWVSADTTLLRAGTITLICLLMSSGSIDSPFGLYVALEGKESHIPGPMLS